MMALRRCLGAVVSVSGAEWDVMIEFDDLELVLAQAVTTEAPRPEVKQRLMARIREEAAAESQEAAPAAKRPLRRRRRPRRHCRPGFAFAYEDDDWHPHPVPGIRMKLLALNRERGYATVLLDVAPGVTFPATTIPAPRSVTSFRARSRPADGHRSRRFPSCRWRNRPRRALHRNRLPRAPRGGAGRLPAFIRRLVPRI